MGNLGIQAMGVGVGQARQVGGDGRAWSAGRGELAEASLGKWAAMGNPGIQAIGSWARQVQASIGKWAAMGNLGIQAIGSWARQV